jgi:uncharacterized protein (DUF2141 family)
MIVRILFLVLLLLTTVGFAQVSENAIAYRTRNPNDKSVIMENESIPLPTDEEQTYAITITVTDIRSTLGVIRFKFYDESTPFPHDKGFLRIVVPKSEVKNNTFTATYYGFPSKKMGIALLDDENDNWELDFGWFLPKEGHAFSNYYHSALRRPVYSDFEFLLTGDKQIIMKLKYY